MAPKTSIAMATFNGAQYIEEQLQSFADQTLKPDELVITDDGSTDATLDIVRDFAREAPFDIRVERNHENLGYARNFGKAIALCSGDIIFLSDQDDVWLPEKLERVWHEFDLRSDIQFIVNDARLVDGSLIDSGLTEFQQNKDLTLKDNRNVLGCCSAFRGCLRDIILPIPPSYGGHDIFMHKISELLDVRYVLDEPLQLYRRHDATATSRIQSSLRKRNRNSLFQSYSREDSRVYTERALQKIDILRDRLQAVRGKSGALPERHFDVALTSLDAWESAARVRLQLLACQRIARLFPASAMYLRGQYSHFSGWRSLAKDLIKP